jgi:hypothetical protein
MSVQFCASVRATHFRTEKAFMWEINMVVFQIGLRDFGNARHVFPL